MNKIWIVLRREYLTRVQKKSFIIMTILGPVLFAALMIVPVLLALNSGSDDKLINVIDKSSYFEDVFKDEGDLKFRFLNTDPDTLKKQNTGDDDFYLLFIPNFDINQPKGIQLFAGTNPSLELKMNLEKRMERKIRRLQLENAGIDPNKVDELNSSISLKTYRLSDSGGEKASSSEAASIAGYLGAFLIYLFIFIYGSMIMRGVMEEKSSRIVEVIVSTVKPFYLMMGKVIGIALVGLTQLAIWIMLTTILTTVGNNIIGQKMGGDLATTIEKQKQANPAEATDIVGTGLETETQTEQNDSQKAAKVYGTIMENVMAINLPLVLFAFVFYFIGGYFFYGALFAAVGGAVDSEAETQQFMMPITIPLILGIIVGQVIIKDPYSNLAFWFSMIPFTSPITMMVRVPFGVPIWELALSMALLIAGFVGTIWLAGRIYRVGILMYGKKITFKEIGKWLFYKD